jgi:hypothetical protein
VPNRMSHGRVPHPGVLALGAALGLTACGGAETPATATTSAAPVRPAPAARPALCGPMRVVKTGTVDAAEATELSGLVVSHTQPGVLWSHNDSGDRPRVFALRTDGRVMASLDVPGAEAVDWEDMAIGPGGDLLIGDIGDNGGARANIDVYRVPEPRLPAVGGVTAPATRLRLRYPDGPHDAETLLADPRTGELVVITKRLDGRSAVFTGRVPKRGVPAQATLRARGTLRFGFGGLATAGDVSADGRTVVVRTYSGFSVWTRRPGVSLAATLRRTPCSGRVSLVPEGQGEAVALTRSGRSFFTVPEGASPTLRRYSTRRN